MAPEGNSLDPETDKIRQYQSKIAGVPVALYDTPGSNDTTGVSGENTCREIKSLIKSKKVCLTIFCFSMNENRLKDNHINTMRCYHRASVNWKNTIVALTFADRIQASRTERKSEGFNEAEHFQKKIIEWKKQITDALIQKVGVPQPVAESLIMCPTTDEWDAKLPDDQEWFVPLWLDILDLLAPAAYYRFLEIHKDNITFEEGTDVSGNLLLKGKDMERFRQITVKKIANVGIGTGGCAIVAGGTTAVVTGSVMLAGVATAGVGVPIIVVGGAAVIVGFLMASVGIGTRLYKAKK